MDKKQVNMMELKALLGLENVPMSSIHIKLTGEITPTDTGAIPSGDTVISFEVHHG